MSGTFAKCILICVRVDILSISTREPNQNQTEQNKRRQEKKIYDEIENRSDCVRVVSIEVLTRIQTLIWFARAELHAKVYIYWIENHIPYVRRLYIEIFAIKKKRMEWKMGERESQREEERESLKKKKKKRARMKNEGRGIKTNSKQIAVRV